MAKPSKNRLERSLWGRQPAAAAVLAVICAGGYFWAKRDADTKSDPSREIAAANLPGPPETVATEAAANSAVALTLHAPETKLSPSLVATEPNKYDPTDASTAKAKSGSEAPSAAAPASIAVKTDAARAESLETEVQKAGAQKSVLDSTACTLNLNTIPASRVAIDGRDLGMTPKIGISVQPGTHVVMFANAGGKKVTSAQCKAGEQKTVVVRLPI